MLTGVIAAGARPVTGTAVDADGVEHTVADPRTVAARQLDALIDALHALHPLGVSGSEAATSSTTSSIPAPAVDAAVDLDDTDEDVPPVDGDAGAGGLSEPGPMDPLPPRHEGEYRLRVAPGARVGPYPRVQILVIATVDQLAVALHADTDTDRLGEHDPPGRSSGPGPTAGVQGAQGYPRASHGVAVPPATLRLLACSGRLRRLLLDQSGAVLGLGRSARYAGAAQLHALAARDGGCLIPGCPVPAEGCDVHHPRAWRDGGRTDLENLGLLCPRHHRDVHDPTAGWQIHSIHGVPWVRPPAWVHPTRPLMRNTTHQPHPRTA